ncbi:hypothetical protein AAFF88_01735 [Hyphobacterium sp. WM6]|uniref:Uncharacterized protein n=1 Tax=Hyphobacterium vulgare TaxID=1736751 RepID=A0ABV7A0Z4_9PROT
MRSTVGARFISSLHLCDPLHDLKAALQRRIRMIPLYREVLVGDLDESELTALLDEYREALGAQAGDFKTGSEVSDLISVVDCGPCTARGSASEP